MKSKLFGLLFLCSTVSLFAQSPDKTGLGFYTMPGYPFVPMSEKSETFAIVKDHIVSMSLGDNIRQSLNIYPSWMTDVHEPDGAEIVIAVNDIFEEVGTVRYFKKGDKRTRPQAKETHQAASELKVRIGRISFIIGEEKKETATPPAPAPDPNAVFIARAYKKLGFNIEVRADHKTVFLDTIFVSQEFESETRATKDLAKEDLQAKLNTLSVTNELKAYAPFLSKVLGMTPIQSNKFNIYKVHLKKKCPYDYADINNAGDLFAQGFEVIKKRQWQIDRFNEIVTPAVKVWESNLAQADLNNENARINKELAAALHYNLAIYYSLIRDFEQAYEHFMQSDLTKLGFGNANEMARLAKTWITAQTEYNKMMENNK